MRSSEPKVSESLTPFVCFGGVDWWYHSHAHSDVQLMLALARERQVLFINSIGMRVPGRRPPPQLDGEVDLDDTIADAGGNRSGSASGSGGGLSAWAKIRRKIGSTLRGLRRPREDLANFWVYSPILLPFYGSRLGRACNAWLLRVQIRIARWRIGMRNTPHCVVTVPTAWNAAHGMPTASLIYNRSDKHSAFVEADPEVVWPLERALLENADRVLYVSESLMNEERPFTGDRAEFLDHGVDLGLFSPQSALEPHDLAAIPHPRIGFFGSLREHLVDLELLAETADALPDVQFVLVGAAPSDVTALTARPNVHFLGPRPHDEIPAYGSGFDVALMPYRRNEWIEACNPIKLKEYLALGLKIVSTDFPAARRYADLIEIALDAEDFAPAIRRALADSTDASIRRSAVANASWRSRARAVALGPVSAV